ncbi:LutC/YkgG family protein [Desulfoluna spongiiphila]|uniref:L-lactate dehydrogenase complex protein LldG n=1 Tax=Desulfoluna spongiiphila TaxID=419481 RepID=A0A1G5IDX7_9BACT|nr:lactate utilization protein [Desulfoluna spongiiphila]SCY73971.1 L-lactate dehydrogenase complex protein LldG [Desulfoluna spongiiphila]VVS95389.1 nagb/rpia transferase-like [Desulfoluna spongiiphila]
MSRSSARARILSRLYKNTETAAYTPEAKPWSPPALSPAKRITRFVELMEAMRSEVYRVKDDEWAPALRKILRTREMATLAYGKGTWCGDILEKSWKEKAHPTDLIPWTRDVEEFRDELFGINAGITTTMGGIAEAAALILWPSPQEPRLLSLVPPVHIALVKAKEIYTSFPEAIKKLKWAQKAPTNSLLISGPSKTADIELILQFGVHGPTDLIVFVIE